MSDIRYSVHSEADIIYEAAKDVITKTRRVLLFVSIVVGIGFFYLFWWYGSWELARIDARRGVAAAIQSINNEGGIVSDSEVKDKSIIDDMNKEAVELEREWSNKHFDIPLVGLKVASADFPQALLVVAGTVLLWLLFYQRRLSSCLTRLSKLEGWERVALLLEHHFTLIGQHANPLMRYVARSLLLALPLLAISFFASDLYDISSISSNSIRRLALTNDAYKNRIAFRIATDLLLALLVCLSGIGCYREFRRIEDNMLKDVSRKHSDSDSTSVSS